ncbi:MAG: hypothetical protein K0R69_1847 [Clostridia bacterium]|jgi:hypothetical protein|nr:hypothetical protein [Clostridia bacterium]
MAKFEKLVNGDFETIVRQLHTDIMQGGLSMNLVDESNYSSPEIRAVVRVYDKYFMRNGNRASLNLTVVGTQDNIFVSAIGAGGGSGALFNFSLGAESEMADLVADSLRKMGL